MTYDDAAFAQDIINYVLKVEKESNPYDYNNLPKAWMCDVYDNLPDAKPNISLELIEINDSNDSNDYNEIMKKCINLWNSEQVGIIIVNADDEFIDDCILLGKLRY